MDRWMDGWARTPFFSQQRNNNSFYSKTKGYMEDMLKSYDNVLILRVRMPISDVRAVFVHICIFLLHLYMYVYMCIYLFAYLW